jgi:hypothetical protein
MGGMSRIVVQVGLDKKYKTLPEKYLKQKGLGAWLKRQSVFLASTRPNSSK